MTNDELVAYLKQGIKDVEEFPGRSVWTKGYDVGWLDLAREIIDLLEGESDD